MDRSFMNRPVNVEDVDRPALTILHTSDCHLGAGEHTRAAMIDLLNCGARLAVDALLIVGDLFDHPRVPDSDLEWLADKLGHVGIPVVILPGNHDPVMDGGIYDRIDRTRCPNVVVLTEPEGTCVPVPGIPVTVWGRATVDHMPEFRPLVGLPPRPPRGWTIVMAHGSVETGDEATHRGSPIYPRDMSGVDWDYLALGHADRYQDVSPPNVPAFYPGNTADSRHGTPGAIVVQMDPATGVTASWISLD